MRSCTKTRERQTTKQSGNLNERLFNSCDGASRGFCMECETRLLFAQIMRLLREKIVYTFKHRGSKYVQECARWPAGKYVGVDLHRIIHTNSSHIHRKSTCKLYYTRVARYCLSHNCESKCQSQLQRVLGFGFTGSLSTGHLS